MEQALIIAPEPGATSPEELRTLDSFPVSQFSAVKDEIEVEEDANYLKIEPGIMARTGFRDRTIELQQDHVELVPTHQPQLLDSPFFAQTQQNRLFNDPRRHKLFAEYNEIKRQHPDSHLARLGELAHYVFENGRPARVWTAGGEGSALVGLDPSKPSIHGICDCKYDDADILLLTESEHAEWSRANNPPKLVVIRDPAFSRRRNAKTTETWLREHERGELSQKLWVDIQKLNRNCDDNAAEKVPLQDAIRQWRTAQHNDAISFEAPPMNFLNISDIKPGHWPEGLARNYDLLYDAIAHCDSVTYKSLDPRMPQILEEDRGIGKPTLLMYSHSDIHKCTQFRILAQRGACSSWHMDNVGVYTFIVLEGNSNDPEEQAEDVVKYWPVYPMHHMNKEEQDVTLAGFAKEGIDWRPVPNGKIPVIALTRGDMLIQPPGTIHAPITLTNCFFLGGMAWRKSTLRQTLDIWHYLMKNEICTNEPLPRQSQEVLEYFKIAVRDAPEDFGYKENELEELYRVCDEISGAVSRCRCSKACSLSTKCSCLMQGLKCGIRCHRGDTLHHKTCTTVNISSPASLSKKKKQLKRSHLKDSEDSDYTSTGTPSAQTGRKKRVVKAPKAKAPLTPELPNKRLDNLPDTDPAELKRPEICPKSSTGAPCAYNVDVRGTVTCRDCLHVIPGEPGRLPRLRTSVPPVVPGSNAHLSPKMLEAASHENKCSHCERSNINPRNMKTGPKGPRTLCGPCASDWAKKVCQMESKNLVEAETLMQNIDNESMAKQWNGDKMPSRCDHCEGPTYNSKEPGGSVTLCLTCEKNFEVQGSQSPPVTAMNNHDNDMSANNALSWKDGKNRPESSRSLNRRPDYSKPRQCLQCQAYIMSGRWYKYDGPNGKGHRCPKCYGRERERKRREKDLGHGVDDNDLPMPSTSHNEANNSTGIKLRLKVNPITNPEHDKDKMKTYSSQEVAVSQLESDVCLRSSDTLSELPQVRGIMEACDSERKTTTELCTATKSKELTPHELPLAIPPNPVVPQITGDLQTIQIHAGSLPLAEYKSQVIDSMVLSPSPQTYPTSGPEPDDVCLIKLPDQNPDHSTFAQQLPTNESSTTRSPTELSDLHYSSSSLSDVGDQFSDDYELEDMKFLKPS